MRVCFENNMTTRDVTGFSATLSAQNSVRMMFSRFWGSLLSTKVLHRRPGKTGKRTPGEKFEISAETAGRNCRFLSLVVVELPLRMALCLAAQCRESRSARFPASRAWIHRHNFCSERETMRGIAVKQKRGKPIQNCHPNRIL